MKTHIAIFLLLMFPAFADEVQKRRALNPGEIRAWQSPQDGQAKMKFLRCGIDAETMNEERIAKTTFPADENGVVKTEDSDGKELSPEKFQQLADEVAATLFLKKTMHLPTQATCCLTFCLMLDSCSVQENKPRRDNTSVLEEFEIDLSKIDLSGRVSSKNIPPTVNQWKAAPVGEISRAEVSFKKFKASDHTFKDCMIDGLEIHGMDGELPVEGSGEVTSMTVTWKGNQIELPRAAFRNAYYLFEGLYDSTSKNGTRVTLDANETKRFGSIRISPDGHMLIIEHDVENGAGSYGITWFIAEDGYLGRGFRFIGT